MRRTLLAKWKIAEEIPLLEHNELQLWNVPVNNSPDWIAAKTLHLSPSEQTIAARRRAGLIRSQFVTARWSLRLLLGCALDIDPQDVPITAGPHGKPETPMNADGSLFYSIAHSRDTILIVLRRAHPVGVDIEYIDTASDVMEIANPWFTEIESSTLAGVEDPGERRSLFYRYWTRKEAVTKADGRGLLLEPNTFAVDFELAQQEPARVSIPSGHSEIPYFVQDIHLNSDYAAALAQQSSESNITQWVFPDESHLRCHGRAGS